PPRPQRRSYRIIPTSPTKPSMNGVPTPLGGDLAELPVSQPTGVRWRILALLLGYSFLSWFNRVSMSVAGDEVIMNSYGITETEMGVLYSAFLVSYTLCMTPGGRFTDRFGGWAALALMGFGSAVFCLCTGLAGWVFLTGGSLWVSLLAIR